MFLIYIHKGVHMNSRNNGFAIWIMGLSAAGKTTLAKALQKKISGSIHLDGDDLRSIYNISSSDFDIKSRIEWALVDSRLVKKLSEQGAKIIISTICLYNEVQKWNRENIPNYVEVFLNVSEETRRRRDPKNLYKKYFNGQIKNIIGLDLPCENPINPDLTFDEFNSVDESSNRIIDVLRSNSLI